MLRCRGAALPHGWVAGDDETGRPAWFRQRLAGDGERYLLAVPSNTTIRDREAEPPPYGGQGRRPKAPSRGVRAWCEALPAGAWTKLTVRDGAKGPLEVEVVARRVESKVDRRAVGFEEMLVVLRYRDGGVLKHDYHLSNAAPETPLSEFARVAKASHRIEECLKRSKSEAGLGEYQVRNWRGWHHRLALPLIATWFLVEESRRGKKTAPALTVPRVRMGLALILHRASGCDEPCRVAWERTRRLERDESARLYRFKSRKQPGTVEDQSARAAWTVKKDSVLPSGGEQGIQ
jgi:SRSO17 transposase